MKFFSPSLPDLTKSLNRIFEDKCRKDFGDKVQNNLKMNSEAFTEFMSFCAFVESLEPKPLSYLNFKDTHGKYYRRTTLLQTLLSLYSEGTIFSIYDLRIDRDSKVHFKSPLVSHSKLIPVLAESIYYSSSIDVYYYIFSALLKDNGLNTRRMPVFLLQDVILPLNCKTTCQAQNGGGTIGFDAKIDPSFLKSIRSLMDISVDVFTDKFPILSQICGINVTPRLMNGI